MQFEVELWNAINRYAITVGGDRGAEISRLHAALTEVRVFLRGAARRPELGREAKDLLDEADAIDRVLDGKEMW